MPLLLMLLLGMLLGKIMIGKHLPTGARSTDEPTGSTYSTGPTSSGENAATGLLILFHTYSTSAYATGSTYAYAYTYAYTGGSSYPTGST